MSTQTVLSRPAPNASAPEELTRGLQRYWLFDKQIVVYKATESSRLVVDVWIDSVKDVMRNWSKTEPYLVIHDFRDNNIAFSPYARSRTAELIKVGIHVPGYAAIVLPQNFVSTIIRMFMRTQKSHGIENRLFLDFDEGLAWLKSKMG
jgi:hypothetical protein